MCFQYQLMFVAYWLHSASRETWLILREAALSGPSVLSVTLVEMRHAHQTSKTMMLYQRFGDIRLFSLQDDALIQFDWRKSVGWRIKVTAKLQPPPPPCRHNNDFYRKCLAMFSSLFFSSLAAHYSKTVCEMYSWRRKRKVIHYKWRCKRDGTGPKRSNVCWRRLYQVDKVWYPMSQRKQEELNLSN